MDKFVVYTSEWNLVLGREELERWIFKLSGVFKFYNVRYLFGHLWFRFVVRWLFEKVKIL